MQRRLIAVFASVGRSQLTQRLASASLILLLASGLTWRESGHSPTLASAIDPATSVGITPDGARDRPAAGAFLSYLIRLAEPQYLMRAGRTGGDLMAPARQQQREDLEAILAQLAAAGQAGVYSYDASLPAFRAELSVSARQTLAGHRQVAAIEPASGTPVAVQTFSGLGASPITAQEIKSVNFIQVYSPFMWGRVNYGGLGITMTLETAEGVVKGVPIQGTAPDSVKIDRNQLYYDTIFVAPGTTTPVMIVPGDRVRVVTTGCDPLGYCTPDDRLIEVNDVRAWTSWDRDTVAGIAPANSTVIVTVASSRVWLDAYVTPGANLTYIQTTSNSTGGFKVAFDGTDPSGVKADLVQGSTGFVRLVKNTGDEIYTVHGENVLALENSTFVHGWVFPLPTAPVGLQPGIAVSRPKRKVEATLKNAAGAQKDTAVAGPGSWTSSWLAYFQNATVVGGDIVEVSIDGSPSDLARRVQTAPLEARMDIAANVVAGSGPASTMLTVGAGRIAGYLTSNSTVYYTRQKVGAAADGIYTSGQFACSTTNTLDLRPGSFGYVGYEDAYGNFIYMALAAPTHHVMVDFPFLEGWLATGTTATSTTIRAPSGSVKEQISISSQLLAMMNERVYINTYYNQKTSQFIEPGDSVEVVSGGQSNLIPVDRLTAYADTDTEAVVGQAPAGKSVRAIPSLDRDAWQEARAEGNGTYSAGNPFRVVRSSNCSEATSVQDFKPGSSGRVYLPHDDGNAVFAAYGRSLHVNENDNYVEIYPFIYRDLDWWEPTPIRAVTVTLTPPEGSPVSATKKSDGGRAGKAGIALTNAQGQKIVIRQGDGIAAAFVEGYVLDGVTRPVTLSLSSLPLVTGSPDVQNSTLAGVGPRGWGGQTTLNLTGAKPTIVNPTGYTAWGPIHRVDNTGDVVPLKMGYSGGVSFSDTAGHRLYSAWAVTAYPVKIIGWLSPGGLLVCGTGPLSSIVNIRDATTGGQDIIGTGGSDAQGNFCVPLNQALYRGQVVLAESGGTYSQPVVVGGTYHVDLPLATKRVAP